MVKKLVRSVLLLFWAISCFSLVEQNCLSMAATVVEAPEWDQMFENENGWLGADGIYSVPIEIESLQKQTSQENKPVRILFLFSDTIFGSTKNRGEDFQSIQMANHSMAILEADSNGQFLPDKSRIRFLLPTDYRRAEDNLLGWRCWLQQGIVIQSSLYLTALRFNSKTWEPEQVDLVRLPLDKSGEPIFQPVIVEAKNKRPQSNRLLRLTYSTADNEGQIVWGAGLYDAQEEGAVYIFGYLDNFRARSRKDLIAAKAPRSQIEDLSSWRFFNGQDWIADPTAIESNEARLARGISSEFSVSRIPMGPGKGKFLLVYTPRGISRDLEYRVGDSPVGPFGKPVRFYRSFVPDQLGEGVFCYNGKGHPALSRPDALLVSYNVNRLGAIAKKPTEYRPRFVWLPYESIQ